MWGLQYPSQKVVNPLKQNQWRRQLLQGLLHHIWTNPDHRRTHPSPACEGTVGKTPWFFSNIFCPYKCLVKVLSPPPGMSDHALVSVQIDAKPKASPDLLFHRMRLLLILYEWKFLSQPSSSMLPPNLLHLSQNGSFLEWRILYHKKIPANLNSHHCFTCKCAAPIAYWNHDFNIMGGGA